jgi:hypothetical protein
LNFYGQRISFLVEVNIRLRGLFRHLNLKDEEEKK